MSQPTERSPRVQPLVLIAAGLIAVVWAVVYGFFSYSAGYNEIRVSVLVFASRMWALEDWEYCKMVPFILAFILWSDRKKLAALPLNGRWIGLPIILVAAFLFWFGYEADIVYFGYASAQIMLAGLIIFLLGWEWMMALSFFWLFLAFLWPLLFLTDMISFPLRVIMSKASVFVLNLVGVPCFLTGTAIVSAPDALTHRPTGALFSVDVAYACSGIRSLFALMMVSALWAHFAVQGAVRKWFMFLCSMPLAVLGNLVRILILTFGTIILGSEIAIGGKDPSAFHEGAGYFIFVVALAGLMIITKLLNLDWKAVIARARHLAESTGGDRPLPPPPGAPKAAGHNEDVY